MGALASFWRRGPGRWWLATVIVLAAGGLVVWTVAPGAVPTPGIAPAAAPQVAPAPSPASAPMPSPGGASPQKPAPAAEPPAPVAVGQAPATPPARVCGDAALLDGPGVAPKGAVVVDQAELDQLEHNWEVKANTTYWFKGGTYSFGSGPFDQIQPKSGDVFTGAPGTVLDGGGVVDYAFVAMPGATNVTIEHLTIEGFIAGEGEGVVGQGGPDGWLIEDNTITKNPVGAGVVLGPHTTVRDNCLTANGEYGFNGVGGSVGVTLTGNEISDNNAADRYDHGAGSIQCGCSGGGKFWETRDAVVTGNYVHDNAGVGIWVDTDNAGFDISGNYIAGNTGEGIIYEISYNADISNNTLIHNAVAGGPTIHGFPDPALYISESGADARVDSWYSDRFLVSGNVFTDNWGGVVLWENANRYCGDGSDHACTLVDPADDTLKACRAHLNEKSPVDYSGDCRWKTQNVLVTHNTFSFTPARVSAACTPAIFCGFNGLFSNYGSTPPYTGPVVPTDITFGQNNRFTDNAYTGPWAFDAWNQGNVVSVQAWTAAAAGCTAAGDATSGHCTGGFGQDSGSTFG